MNLALPKEEYVSKEKVEKIEDKEEVEVGEEEEEEEAINEGENFEPSNKVIIQKPEIKKSKFYENQTLFIKNLNFNTSEENLKEFFETFGKVKYAKIVKNKETNTSRGTGFVLMESKNDSMKILKLYEKSSNSKISGLNPFELEGRNIEVINAVARENVDKIVKDRKKRNGE